MEKIKIEQIPVNERLGHELFHKSGVLAHFKDDVLKPDNIKLLRDNNISYLVKPDSGENLSQLIFNLKHSTILVKDIDEQVELSMPLYKENGTLLLDTGKKISAGMKASLTAQGIERLFLKRKEAELETENITKYKRSLALLNSKVEFKNRAVENIRIDTSRIISGKEQITPENLDKMVADFDQINLKPTGEALSKMMIKRNPLQERSQAEKIGYLNAFEEIIVMAEELFNLIKKEDNIHSGKIDELTKKIINAMLHDKDLLLNMIHISKTKDYMIQHALNVCVLSVNIATAMGFNAEQVLEIAYGAFLSDIGMLKLPENLVTKPGKLTPNELLDIQKHPSIGVDILKNSFMQIPVTAPLIIYQIHERLDGSGYPKARKSVVIHRYSKLIAVADVYDALISKKTWRPAKLPYQAMEELLQLGNQQKLDIDAIRGFLKYNSVFPIGSMVQLSDGRRAKVISSNETDYTRPVVCIMEMLGGQMKDQERIDLCKEKGLTIKSILQLDHNKENLLKGF